MNNTLKSKLVAGLLSLSVLTFPSIGFAQSTYTLSNGMQINYGTNGSSYQKYTVHSYGTGNTTPVSYQTSTGGSRYRIYYSPTGGFSYRVVTPASPVLTPTQQVPTQPAPVPTQPTPTPTQPTPTPAQPAPTPTQPAPTPTQPAPTPTQPAPAPAQPGDTQLTAGVQEMLNYVNEERAKVGVKPLAIDSALNKVAQLKAQDMKDNNYFSHTSPTYGSPFDMMKQFGIQYYSAGENIAKNGSIYGAHVAFMNSDGHRKNILNGNYTHMGIGIVDYQYGKIIVEMFIQK